MSDEQAELVYQMLADQKKDLFEQLLFTAYYQIQYPEKTNEEAKNDVNKMIGLYYSIIKDINLLTYMGLQLNDIKVKIEEE